ncbi:hypothetical protein [Noviherbaspirillum pedocola]|uniref:Uncharacterized protein n=1 Tax=Noviherbaspirillum pedocola TaxID=2801341 RepID=A0A934W414_9BURK|nr:hypothetical protein [Noviherbaspirillum pedocola]MBK4738026.1 hypothetical protein [Noviherbaspirillum pedocola]
MNNITPNTLGEAIIFGLKLLDDDSKRELAKIGWVNPHTKYETDFIGIVGAALGILDKTNQSLLQDIATNHADCLHFLDTDGSLVEPDAAIRVVLSEMSKVVLL